MALTNLDLRNAKPAEKLYKIFDGGGLHLVVSPTGGKLWRMKYRFQGKERLLSFGPYPLFTLAEARAKRDEMKKLLAAGIDPSEKKKADKVAGEAAKRSTFRLVAEDYLARMEGNSAAEATLDKNRWLLLDLAKPIGDRPISEITPAELLDMLKHIEKSGRRESARRLRGVVGSVFRYAIVTLRATADPTTALRGALLTPKVTPRAAILDERKLGGLMLAIDAYDGWPTITAALKFLALTCARPGEVRGARRGEIDLDKACWKIAAERTKMRRPHDVPLSRQAIVVLRDIWPLSDGGDLVFPSVRSHDRPLSENAMNSALRRMGYSQEEMSAHGFRSSASTILNGRDFKPDVIEAALGHQDENSIRRAYNRASYWAERVELMQTWADLLDGFRKL
jgi:integrase